MKNPSRFTRWLLLAAVLVGHSSGIPLRAEDTPQAEVSTHAPLVIIGASASSGFVPTEPFGGPKTPEYRLGNYLAAALVNPNTPMKSFATAAFFFEADKQAKTQIEDALAAKPRAVVGVDFLFWFCYGRVANEDERRARFERGLAYLEQLSCPLVIGDIPDASAAAGGMLNIKQVPPPESIAAANRRLAEWVSARKNVSLISLSTFMNACMEDRAFAIGPLAFPDGQTRKLLQSDKLHPARHGCAVLALAIMDALTKERGVIAQSDVRWDVEEIFQRAVKASAKPVGAGSTTQ